MKQQIRISMTDEVQGALNYLKQKKYPILSYPEIIRVVLSKEVSKEKASKQTYPEPSSDILMQSSADAFMVHDEDEVEYTAGDICKPFKTT